MNDLEDRITNDLLAWLAEDCGQFVTPAMIAAHLDLWRPRLLALVQRETK